jgi:hypothetical protein
MPDLNNVKLPVELNRSTSKEFKLFDGTGIFNDLMFHHALSNYHHFDILTYTISPMHVFGVREIHRLMFCVGKPPRKTKRHIRISCSHAKLWICYRTATDTDPHVYLGSANATEMTLHELMVRVTGDGTRSLIKHFNYLWENNQ